MLFLYGGLDLYLHETFKSVETVRQSDTVSEGVDFGLGISTITIGLNFPLKMMPVCHQFHSYLWFLILWLIGVDDFSQNKQ